MALSLLIDPFAFGGLAGGLGDAGGAGAGALGQGDPLKNTALDGTREGVKGFGSGRQRRQDTLLVADCTHTTFRIPNLHR